MPPPAKQKKSESAPKTIKRKKKAKEPFWLPDELFQEVFKYLPWSSLKSCRLVSRKWKGLVDHSSVLKCAAMNVIQQYNIDIEERLQCELIKFVGKVNLKQPYSLKLIDEYDIYLKENSIEADLTNVQEMIRDPRYAFSFFLFMPFPNLVVSLVKSKNSTHVSTHLEVKHIGSGENAAGLAKEIDKLANGEATVESLDLYDFDVIDDEFEYINGENGAEDICVQFGKTVSGPEYFIELFVKVVCVCKEVTLTNHGNPSRGEVGPYQPIVINEIMRAIANTPSSKLKLKKLEFDFWADYELGDGNNGGYLDSHVFAAAVCKLEDVRFCGIPVAPELEEVMFKAIRDTPPNKVVLKSLKIGFVTTKAQILASAALKLVDLRLNFASHEYATGNRHEQCSQAKAILDRIHKAKTLRLENLEIGLYDKIYHGEYKTYYERRKSWSYPEFKMEEIKAKLKNLKIDDQTNARDEEGSEDDEDFPEYFSFQKISKMS